MVSGERKIQFPFLCRILVPCHACSGAEGCNSPGEGRARDSPAEAVQDVLYLDHSQMAPSLGWGENPHLVLAWESTRDTCSFACVCTAPDTKLEEGWQSPGGSGLAVSALPNLWGLQNWGKMSCTTLAPLQ